jgi:cytochrome P450
LGWVLYEICRSAEVAERVHVEVDAVLCGRPPEFDDVPKLEYLGREINEVLRLRTPVLFSRRTLTNTIAGGLTIPADAEMIYSPYLQHHDARWFPDPHRFNPDRWLPENAQMLPKNAYIPVAAGAYQCIGKIFAITELTVAPSVICAGWRTGLVPGTEVREVARALIRPSKLSMIAFN